MLWTEQGRELEDRGCRAFSAPMGERLLPCPPCLLGDQPHALRRLSRGQEKR